MLSDNGASEKLERAKKKIQVGIGDGGAGAGEREILLSGDHR